MQSQQNNLYMWTPNSDVSSQVGPIDEDLELFGRLSSHHSIPNSYQQPQQQQQQEQVSYLSMVPPLISPPASDLSEAVARMNMEDQFERNKQRLSLSSNLSLDIQPCISITEPTPIYSRGPALNLVDNFIDNHFAELNQPAEQQHFQQQNYQQQQSYQQQQNYQQQQQQQQHESFTQLMDPSFIDDLLIAETGQPDWLSWTPVIGSPASNYSNSFDDHNSIYSTSPEPSFYNTSVTLEDIMHPTVKNNYPSPSFSEFNNNTLTVKKSNRSRRVSEPPKPSQSIIQEQFNNNNNISTDRSIRRSNSDKRSRSNSNASPLAGNHHCPHPGCGKSFTRPYNLTSHMRTHTSDRPFACSQCGRKFARQHDRNRHEKLHWGIKPYACSHCKKPFARMDALNRHLRVENGCSSNPPL